MAEELQLEWESTAPHAPPRVLAGPFLHFHGRSLGEQTVKIVHVTDLNSLLNAPTRTEVVADLTKLADTTIANQSGLTGMALKSALGAAKKADADALSKGINQLMPSIVEELTPHWESYEGSGTGFGAHLADNEDSVTESVLKIGDSFADRAPAPVQKVYSSMRGKVGKIVAPALPEFGDIIERHAK